MTIAPEIERTVCRKCFAVLDAPDCFCRHCGAPTENAPTDASDIVQAQVVSENPTSRSKAMDNPWVVLAMLFLVLGPLGLPMLWRCSRIDTIWKVVLTVVVIGIVAVIIALVWFVLHQALAPLQELKTLRGF